VVRFLGRLALAGLGLFVILVAAAALLAQRHPIEELARKAPRRTALMDQREREARSRGRSARVDQRWVPYSRISPLLRRAVLVAEDDAFFSHGGFDWKAIRESARRNLEERRVVRGGSTVTQQLAKNLYLGDRRTPWRKLEEFFLAMRLERRLPKRRILELYLNLIEWGDGIYGAEAAARRHFGVPASSLDSRQSVLLAAIIINPRRYSPLHPSRRIDRRVRTIASRLRRRGFLDEDQYLAAIGTPRPEPRGVFDWLFGPKEEAPPAPVPDFSEPESTAFEGTEVEDSVATVEPDSIP
jgi:monofunctional biosynthetic peptidoglycan transglycosylase